MFLSTTCRHVHIITTGTLYPMIRMLLKTDYKWVRHDPYNVWWMRSLFQSFGLTFTFWEILLWNRFYCIHSHFSGVPVARSLVFCVMFCRSLRVLFVLAIVLSVLLRLMASDYTFGILWPLCCLFSFDCWLLITPLVSCGHCIVCSSSIVGFWLHLWSLYFLSFDWWLLITPLVSCGHCIVCSSSIDGFWLHLWYLVAIVFSVLLRLMASNYSFGILWPLYSLFFFDWWLLITSLISSDYTFGIFWIHLW